MSIVSLPAPKTTLPLTVPVPAPGKLSVLLPLSR